ncbi:uncharacterized protein N7483_007375 [Penicillium malachiteum]|uniref:uncharacterized protein n=1 Tax=Penicillium malachiteum TaxID=1324776 RepID=UPI00254833D3|nr:uncharacterized protein N7483_007375 [Penicillium malachiteum]KAJ5726018.1 hypothetical protein N7483_007375 [Penicillium malachiteum]
MPDATTIYVTSTATGAESSNTGSGISFTSSNTSKAEMIFITSKATKAESSSIDSTSLTTSSGTSNRPASYTSGKELSTGVKAGIGVGVSLSALLLVLVAFFFHMRRRKRRGFTKGDLGNNVPVLPELGMDGQKHELSAEESRRVELPADEQKNSNLHELE